MVEMTTATNTTRECSMCGFTSNDIDCFLPLRFGGEEESYLCAKCGSQATPEEQLEIQMESDFSAMDSDSIRATNGRNKNRETRRSTIKKK